MLPLTVSSDCANIDYCYYIVSSRFNEAHVAKYLKQEKEMATKKAATVKKSRTTEKITKGDAYTCEVCGLAVSIDSVCGCVDVCDIVCCGTPMTKKRARATTAKK